MLPCIFDTWLQITTFILKQVITGKINTGLTMYLHYEPQSGLIRVIRAKNSCKK